ncbi:hypothetical protein [Desulfocurvus sp. DL9XJH121]
MKTVETIIQLAKQAKNEGIALESARLCTVCWTVHEEDSCPECAARQWLHLAPMLKGFAHSEDRFCETAVN